MTQVAEGSSNMASLYVGDLKADINEQTLWNVFSPFGTVVSVRICRDIATQTSLGYAYVNYRTHMEAEEAIKNVNFASIDGKPCRVMWSMRDSNRRKQGIGNLLLKNLHPGVDSRTLYDSFSNFGAILSCKVAIDEYGVSKGFGFIQFYSEKDAQAARLRSDKVPFRGKKLCVVDFIPKSARKTDKSVDPNDFTNIFVKGFSQSWTEDDLKMNFSTYGQITSIFLGKNPEGESLKFGFINFASPADAKAAVEGMNNKEIGEYKIYVGRAQRKYERVAILKRQHEMRKLELFKKTQDRNVYVKNFDENFTLENLKEMFSKFGTIESATVMTDDSGKSKGFGFVCFVSPESAKAAIEGMHTKVLDTKPLYVCLAQSREERKKIMDQRAYNTGFRPPIFGAPGGIPFMYPPTRAGIPAVPYNPGFPRYNHQMMGNRPPRANQSVPQGVVTSYQHQGGRNNSQYTSNQGYQPRGNRPHQPRYNNNQNYRSQNVNNNIPSIVTNQVQINTSHDPPLTEKKVHKNAPVQSKSFVDPDAAFSNKIYSMAEKICIENGDESRASIVAGIVIDYCKGNLSFSDSSDAELKKFVKAAYSASFEKNDKATEGEI